MKIRFTIVGEYPADPKWYPGTDGDPKKMVAMDQQSYDEGDLDLGNLLDGAETLSVTFEQA